ncbi:MAG: ABC transporter permease subunit [Halolamina sp.]|uniref:ABC transporter permease subunit n=1 Tax=Halolamina sp. TaxID=1940283 RepID=UPI002FC2FB10
MSETFWYETERRLKGTVVFAVVVSLYAVFAVGLFPSVETANVDFERLMESYPEALREAFGVEAIGTIEGFLAGELYNFVWVLLLGVYFAYRAGGMIAADIERGRMDLLLSLPISRARLLVEKYASLIVPITVVNIVTGITVYAGTVVIGHAIDPVAIVMVHLLSIPYLLACAAIGLVFSVVLDRADIAQRAALGALFVLYLIESLATSTEQFEALKYLSPTYYYAPTDVLVRESYAVVDTAILGGMAVGLLFCSYLRFKNRDI